MKKTKISFALLISFIMSLFLAALAPIISFADSYVVYINSKEDFLEFAKSCSYDAWSRGKSFALSADISLEGESFSPIPSFSGTFDGAGHKISGLNITGAYSPAGLFAKTEKGAVIKNLTVIGAVAPEGDKGLVGGIVGDNAGTLEGCSFIGTVIGRSQTGGVVGFNRLTGSLLSCSADGEIIGENCTGGIVGSNAGLISDSQSFAKVNTISTNPSISLDELNISLTLDITKLPSLSGSAPSDTGGIAGYSTGIILGCNNSGTVGYKHIGYNVGGIVGRSSGHLASNENTGDVFGRKDVGGIVGHLEPYISYNLSEDILASLKSELDAMNGLIDKAASDTKGQIPAVSNRINAILTHLEDATGSLEAVMNGIGKYGDDLTDEVNRIGEILDHTISLIAVEGAGISDITKNISDSLNSLNLALDKITTVPEGEDTSAYQDLILAVGYLNDAMTDANEGLNNIKDGFASLQSAAKITEGQEEAVEEALTTILNGTTELSKAFSSLSDALGKLSVAIENGNLFSSEVTAALKQLSTSMDGLSDATTKISNGISVISGNVNLDFTSIYTGLSEISAALSDFSDASTNVGNSLNSLTGALNKSESAVTDIKDSVGHLKAAMDNSSKFANKIKSVIQYLNSTDPIQLPTPSEDISVKATELFVSLKAMESELKLLNLDITSISDELVGTLSEINKCTERISDILVEMIYGLNNTDIFDDEVSEEEIHQITYGKVYSSHNKGRVYADINVGGIAGVIGLEFALDPEDDLTGELSITQKKVYQLKAVIHNSKNSGDVISKRDCVGGIVGKMDFGTIYGCESYGNVTSEAGDYVGGIAGISAGLISTCYSKCTLSGGKHIGGIVGSSVTEDFSGDGSLVKGCYSMVEITAYTQFAGAISGSYTGEYEENYFVSDTLWGIDRVSYSGKAEPIKYEDLIKRRYIPDTFYGFTLDFVADGVIVKSLDFKYGDSFDESVFPKIPNKDGHYGYWDTTELKNLTFDTVVSAVYKPYITAIGSEEKREDGREIFFVDGEFTDGEKISISKSSSHSTISSLEENLLSGYEIIESWVLNIPGGKFESHNIHFLPSVKNASVYIRVDGEWIEMETEELGSYLTFDANGDEISIALVKKTPKILAISLMAVGVLLLSLAVVMSIVYKKQEKKRK